MFLPHQPCASLHNNCARRVGGEKLCLQLQSVGPFKGLTLHIPHYIISPNTFHWTRAVGYIGVYPTVLYFLSYILAT